MANCTKWLNIPNGKLYLVANYTKHGIPSIYDVFEVGTELGALSTMINQLFAWQKWWLWSMSPWVASLASTPCGSPRSKYKMSWVRKGITEKLLIRWFGKFHEALYFCLNNPALGEDLGVLIVQKTSYRNRANRHRIRSRMKLSKIEF